LEDAQLSREVVEYFVAEVEDLETGLISATTETRVNSTLSSSVSAVTK
jgi:hypothetical protein